MFECGLAKRFKIKSDFTKNVLTLTSGTALAQLIPFIIAPILSRIYSPEEFGRLALYISIIQTLGVISSGRYELAIMLPKRQAEAVKITILSIIVTILFSIIILILTCIFSKQVAIALGDEKLELWLYLVPLSTLLIGIFNALNYFNTREKKFKTIAVANIVKSFGANFMQLGLGLLRFTEGGLIVGQSTSHLFGNLKMLKVFLKFKDEIKRVKKIELIELAKRYKDFPKFSTWGIFLNMFSLNITNFLSRGSILLQV